MADRRTFLKLLAGAAIAPAAGRIGAVAVHSGLVREISARHLAFWGFRTPPSFWPSYVSRIVVPEARRMAGK